MIEEISGQWRRSKDPWIRSNKGQRERGDKEREKRQEKGERQGRDQEGERKYRERGREEERETGP